MDLAGKRIVLGMTGGIAAYKVCELVRRMQDEGAAVRVVMTRSAQEFVSATTMQALALGLERYEASAIHRSTLTLDDARAVLESLTGMTNAERAALPVMALGRGDVIVAGCEVLVTVMERWGFDRALVSETDILDGSAAELLRSG